MPKAKEQGWVTDRAGFLGVRLANRDAVLASRQMPVHCYVKYQYDIVLEYFFYNFVNVSFNVKEKNLNDKQMTLASLSSRINTNNNESNT